MNKYTWHHRYSWHLYLFILAIFCHLAGWMFPQHSPWSVLFHAQANMFTGAACALMLTRKNEPEIDPEPKSK